MEYDRELSYRTVGGTDISVLTGSNRYDTPFGLLNKKRNKIDTELNLKMKLGILLEDPIAEIYAYNKGITLEGIDEGSLVFDDIYRISIDRRYIHENIGRIIDFKTRWAYWKEQILPLYYCEQVNYYTGIYDEYGLFKGNFPGDPLVVTLYQGELYECSVPYSPEYYRIQKDIARDFFPYIFNTQDLPFELIYKWQSLASKFHNIYEDLKCRKMSGLVVEQPTKLISKPVQKESSTLLAV